MDGDDFCLRHESSSADSSMWLCIENYCSQLHSFARALLGRVNELLEAGHREFVLNLADVSHIDSFGLGQLKLDGVFHLSRPEVHA
jgi:hypothetical protein